MSPVLEVKGLTKAFGGIQALSGVDLTIQPKQIMALIGPNGAGKTTFFNCLTGMYIPDQGEIQLAAPVGSTSLKGLKPNRITGLGMARTFQNIRLFDQLTVIENVMVGLHDRLKSNFLDAILQSKRHKREEAFAKEEAYQLLERMNLVERAGAKANSLSYADQRRLEIARALATGPKLLLLDEPAAGMNHAETAELDDLILSLRDDLGISILLIEHDMKLVMKISDSITVMDRGSSIACGSPIEIRENKKVIAAYLGEESDA